MSLGRDSELMVKMKVDINFYMTACSGKLNHFAFSNRMMTSRCDLQFNFGICSQQIVYFTCAKPDFVRAQDMPSGHFHT
jgi:hypothetical protein